MLDGRELQFHPPFQKDASLLLSEFIPEEWEHAPLEVEIGPGKGEFLARRAPTVPQNFLLGIDKRQDRVDLTQNKISGRAPITQSGPMILSANSRVIREDARRFSLERLPPFFILHIYHPDPWPKAKHHKNRFFRSPMAKEWTKNLISGGELRVATDHPQYFEEIVDILSSWSELGSIQVIYSKYQFCSEPCTHFEKLFLNKGQAVYKLLFRRN